MDVRSIADPAEFLAATEEFLAADEARHNLILGLAGVLRDRPGYYPEFRLRVVLDRDRVVGAALQTPPHNLVLAKPETEAAASALADALARDDVDLPGVSAAVPEADGFAAAWEARRGVARTLQRAQRIYAISEVRPPRDVPGHARVATGDDEQLLVEWVEAFQAEASPSAPGDVKHVVRGRLEADNAGFLLWEDGEAVSLAGWGGPTPNGIRIGPVYTPPGHRSRGYASAVTAALSADQLASGRRFCFLYTDLANPTSNRVYTRIGYVPVCDAVDYRFEPSASAT
jgi:uncharacterized protein